MEEAPPEDVLRLLVQRVGRAFYEKEQVVVLDMLLNYQGMSAEVLSQKLQMPIKQLQSHLNRMEKDHLLAWELGSLKTGKDGKPIKTKIYFINYKRFVDSVKYKIMIMRARLQSFAKHKEEEIFYFRCVGWCQRQFSMLDALQLKRQVYTGTGFEFVCDKCDVPLQEIDNSETVQGGQQQQQRLIDQLKPFNDMLRRTEELIIPSYTGSPSDEVMAYKEYEEYRRQEAERGPGGSSTGGHYFRKQNAPDYYQKLEKDIEIRIADAPSAAENKKSQPLPIWMQGSTVTGGHAAKRARLDPDDVTAHVVIRNEDDAAPFESSLSGEHPSDYIETYYSQLLQEQEQGLVDDTEGMGDEDDESDEFVEVPLAAPPQISSAPTLPLSPTNKAVGSGRDNEDDEEGDEFEEVPLQM